MATRAVRRVVLCVGGGIAAYKAPELVRAFVGRGHEVRVLMTNAAANFVTPMALSAVSKAPVRTSLLDLAEEGGISHIELADWAEICVVAPGTANLMARARAGMADDIVTAVLLATKAPVLWAPAMNTNMWQHPATRENLRALGERGAHFVGPDRGELACGWVGEGRMIDPPAIVDAAEAILGAETRSGSDSTGRSHGSAMAAGTVERRPWAGRRILVSAGPTRAYVDPVRFISNASTGAMGFELAAAACEMGAEVTIVAGPVEQTTPAGARRHDIETATELLSVMDEQLSSERYDLVAMVAAVADLVPGQPSERKLEKRKMQAHLGGLEWRAEVDVLATLVERHREKTCFLGFAAQTVEADDAASVDEALLAYGTEKLRRKRTHAVFVNRVGVAGSGFASTTNAGHLIVDEGQGSPPVFASGPPMSKRRLAEWLLDKLDEHVVGR